MQAVEPGVDGQLIAILSDLTEEWGLDEEIGLESKIVADLEFESIDIIQLVVAIEKHFARRNMGFDELLMKDGKYVDDLSVRQISTFVKKKLVTE